MDNRTQQIDPNRTVLSGAPVANDPMRTQAMGAFDPLKTSAMSAMPAGGPGLIAEVMHNTAWREMGFRGYADYMETAEFKQGVARLLEAAQAKATAIMCAEKSWRSCHRALISDHLKASGMEIIHILDANTIESHPWTPVARLIDGRLSYTTAAIDQPQLPF